jgi:hypothetical protein
MGARNSARNGGRYSPGIVEAAITSRPTSPLSSACTRAGLLRAVRRTAGALQQHTLPVAVGTMRPRPLDQSSINRFLQRLHVKLTVD